MIYWRHSGKSEWIRMMVAKYRELGYKVLVIPGEAAMVKKSKAEVEEGLKQLGIATEDPTWIKAGLSRNWHDKVLEAAALQAGIDAQAAELKTLKEEIKEAQIRAGATRVVVDSLRCTVYEGKNTRLGKKKLLEYGVTVEIIERSTVTTEFVACKISVIKEAGDGPDER